MRAGRVAPASCFIGSRTRRFRRARMQRHRSTNVASGPDDLDVAPGDSRERGNVVRIRRDNSIAVVRQEDEGRIHDITATRRAKQGTARATQRFIQRPHLGAGQDLRQSCLPRAAAAPDLSHDPAVRHRDHPRAVSRLVAAPRRSIVPLQRDQRPAVEDQPHRIDQAALWRRPRGLRPAPGRPRTTSAAFWSARSCARSSSSVMIPCSLS